MPVVSTIRQYVIDVDANGQFSGATKVVQRRVVENGVDIGGMENAFEPVPVDQLATILGETAASHVAALDNVENILDQERTARAAEKAAFEQQIASLETALQAEYKTNQTLTARQTAVRQMIESWT